MITWGTDALSTSRGIYSKRSDSSIRFVIILQLDIQFLRFIERSKSNKDSHFAFGLTVWISINIIKGMLITIKDVGSKPTSQLIIIQRCQDADALSTSRGIYSKRSDSSIRFIITSQLDIQFFRLIERSKSNEDDHFAFWRTVRITIVIIKGC